MVHEGPIWPMGYDESEPRWTDISHVLPSAVPANIMKRGSRSWNVPLRCPVMYTLTWVQSKTTYNCVWPAGPTTGCGWAGAGASSAAGSLGHCERLPSPHCYWVPIAFHALLPHLGADAKLCINELMTMVAVKQIAMELEDHGHVWVIAIHWHAAQAQLCLGPYATMQQALHPLLSCLIGQLLGHTPAVIWEKFTTLPGSLRAQDIFRLTPDVLGMSNPRLLALYPAKEWQGSALRPQLGIWMVVVPASACLMNTMESPPTIRDTDVSVSWPKLVKQLLRTLHAETQACGGKGGSNLQHIQFAHLVGLVLSLQGCQEWHDIAVVVVHEQVVKQSKALMHSEPVVLSIVLLAPP